MRKRWLKWGLLSGAAAGVVFLAVALWLLRPAHVKSLAESGLSEHLNLDASIESIEVDLFPRPRISGTGLSLRIPDRLDLPPFIYIDHFSVAVGLLSVIRRHVDTVHAGGLRIAVPPAGSRSGAAGGSRRRHAGRRDRPLRDTRCRAAVRASHRRSPPADLCDPRSRSARCRVRPRHAVHGHAHQPGPARARHRAR